MVEGKVNESFGPTIDGWLKNSSPGKTQRLGALTRILGLKSQPGNGIRYQLLHRAASAVITGEQYRAVAAVLIVHSFSQEREHWRDYQDFAGLFGVEAIEGVVQRLGSGSVPPLFGVWVVGDEKFLRK